jgi:hypothetical protein
MPKPFSILTTVVAASACAALVCAQEVSPADNRIAAVNTAAGDKKPDASAAAKPADAPAAEAAPSATPKPKKSVLGWLFGSKKRKGTPAPAASPSPEATPKPGTTPRKGAAPRKPTATPEAESPSAESTPKPANATPAPKPTPAPKATPTPKPTPTPKASPTPKATNVKSGKPPETTPKPEKPAATPKPEKAPSTTPAPATPAATPTGKKGKTKPVATEANATSEPAPEVDPEVKEKARFETAKAKALEDAQIKGLKAKADGATTEEESKTALRNYNKALFQKIKKIDPSVSEWSDRMEAAILKRLSE